MIDKKKYFQEYREKNREKLNSYRRDYYQKNKDKFRQWNQTSFERRIKKEMEKRKNEK